MVTQNGGQVHCYQMTSNGQINHLAVSNLELWGKDKGKDYKLHTNKMSILTLLGNRRLKELEN